VRTDETVVVARALGAEAVGDVVAGVANVVAGVVEDPPPVPGVATEV